MKRSDQAASPAFDYTAPTLEIVVVATECGIAQTTTNNLPNYEDGGDAF